MVWLSDSCPSADELRSFAVGVLNDFAMEGLAEHLDRCTNCSAIVEQISTLTDSFVIALRDLPAGHDCDDSAIKRLRGFSQGLTLRLPMWTQRRIHSQRANLLPIVLAAKVRFLRQPVYLLATGAATHRHCDFRR